MLIFQLRILLPMFLKSLKRMYLYKTVVIHYFFSKRALYCGLASKNFPDRSLINARFDQPKVWKILIVFMPIQHKNFCVMNLTTHLIIKNMKLARSEISKYGPLLTPLTLYQMHTILAWKFLLTYITVFFCWIALKNKSFMRRSVKHINNSFVLFNIL